jgi:hypothetical protein
VRSPGGCRPEGAMPDDWPLRAGRALLCALALVLELAAADWRLLRSLPSSPEISTGGASWFTARS